MKTMVVWRTIPGKYKSAHVAVWADLLEIEVHPVIEDDAAGAAAKKVFGK